MVKVLVLQLGTKSNDISFLLLLFLPYSKCNYAGNSNNNSCVQLERGFAKHEVERTAIYTFRGLTTNWRNKYDPSAEYCTGEEGRGWWVDIINTRQLSTTTTWLSMICMFASNLFGDTQEKEARFGWGSKIPIRNENVQHPLGLCCADYCQNPDSSAFRPSVSKLQFYKFAFHYLMAKQPV